MFRVRGKTKITYISGVIIENMYLLECHHIEKRSIEPHHNFHTELTSHRLVKFAEQQKILSRKKRQFNNMWRQFQQPFQRPQTFQRQQMPAAQENYIDLMHLNDPR